LGIRGIIQPHCRRSEKSRRVALGLGALEISTGGARFVIDYANARKLGFVIVSDPAHWHSGPYKYGDPETAKLALYLP
jgi:hypothetical protein